MELKYKIFIYIGIAVCSLLFILIFIKLRGKKKYTGGKRVVTTDYISNEPYFKRKLIAYKLLGGLALLACTAGIAVSFAMLARPYKTETTNKEKYNRDIMLCIDVSTSVDYLNMNLLKEMKDTVENLKGERIGIVIFNSSPVYLVPLTDDYEYVMDQLDLITKSLKQRIKTYESYDYEFTEDYYYMSEYISAGTQVGVYERGSSLIGDGLAAAVYDFPDLEEEPDRTRIIIFCTDNELAGEPFVTTEEAGTIAKKNNIKVYGVGTKEMNSSNKREMKAAVEKTGGKFYLEEESGTFKEIVKNIEKESKSLVKVDLEVREYELPELPFYLLLISVSAMFIFARILRR